MGPAPTATKGSLVLLVPDRNPTNKATGHTTETISTLLVVYYIYVPLLPSHSLCAGLYLQCHESDQRTDNRPGSRSSIRGPSISTKSMDTGDMTKALLALPLASDTDIKYLRHWLRIMEGWRWNLISLLLVGLVVATLSVMACLRERQMARNHNLETRNSKLREKRVAASDGKRADIYQKSVDISTTQ